MDENIIQSAKSFIQDLFRNDAGGHDVSHTMRVYRNTLEIAASEPDCDAGLAALAALLHDADDHKLFATEHNANARAFLEGNMSRPMRSRRSAGSSTLFPSAKTAAGGLTHLRDRSSRMRTGWMRWERSGSPEHLLTAVRTAGPLKSRSDIFTTSC